MVSYKQKIPASAVSFVELILFNEQIDIICKKNRKGKWGDFRPPFEQKNARITINSDLPESAFLLTLIHEIAHLKAWNKFGKKIQAHGKEWKDIFKQLCVELLNLNILPSEVEQALKNHIKCPKSSICYDPEMMNVLIPQTFEKDQKILKDLEIGSLFSLQNRVFIKQKTLRTRAKCLEIKTQRHFVIHQSAKISCL